MGWKGPFSSITLVVRAHAERLATEQYPNGLLGLEADRETRKQKARDGRAKVISSYEKRVAEAAKVRRWVGWVIVVVSWRENYLRTHINTHAYTHSGRQKETQTPQGVSYSGQQRERVGSRDGL